MGRPRRRWEDNIKMDLREVGYDGRDWINFAQDRDQWRAYVRTAMNLRVPQKPVITCFQELIPSLFTEMKLSPGRLSTSGTDENFVKIRDIIRRVILQAFALAVRVTCLISLQNFFQKCQKNTICCAKYRREVDIIEWFWKRGTVVHLTSEYEIGVTTVRYLIKNKDKVYKLIKSIT
ncbi:hypothetical protein ANN_16360 [Periplaneta americana]|uniref:Uncharacterized protein n=1 Tax=Periplaneta americana TaxID=6978 RepID=A0ABQ8SJR0_PERAM|nr:hypothetical protein ANN_16360 [Periplaneta americana]